MGNSLVVWLLGLHASTAGIVGSVPYGWTKIPQAAQHNQQNKISDMTQTGVSLINQILSPTQAYFRNISGWVQTTQ